MLILYLLIKGAFFTFLNLFNILGYSYLFNRIFNKHYKISFLYSFFFGTIAIAIFSYSINLFSPLNIYITNFFFLLFTFLGLIYFKNFIFYKYKLIILITLSVSFITTLSLPYNDYELYHLPYMEIIRKFKIIFGLSNFDFRYAHTSIFQNISAFQYNSLMKSDSYIFYTPVLFIISIIYLYRYLLKTNLNIIFFISLTSLIFFIIHGSRYGALGNDMPTHVLAILAILLFIDINNKKIKKSAHFIFLNIITILILSKFSLIFFIFLPLILLFKNKLKIEKSLFVFIIIGLLFLIKNFINSSCLVYPIPNLCISTKWSTEKISFASPVTISTQSSASVKAFMESEYFLNPKLKNKFIKEKKNEKYFISNYSKLSDSNKEELIDYLFYKTYLKKNIWIKEYFQSKDFKKLFERIILLNLIILFFTFIYSKRKNIFYFSTKETFLFVKNNSIVLFFISSNTLFWFFNFPQMRYGLSYLLIFFLIPSLLIFCSSNLLFLKNSFKSLLILALIYAFYSNIKRYVNTKNQFENNLSISSKLVPLNPAKIFNKYPINKDIELLQPIDGVCSNSAQLCSVFTERFLKTGRNINKTLLNYIIIGNF